MKTTKTKGKEYYNIKWTKKKNDQNKTAKQQYFFEALYISAR